MQNSKRIFFPIIVLMFSLSVSIFARAEDYQLPNDAAFKNATMDSINHFKIQKNNVEGILAEGASTLRSIDPKDRSKVTQEILNLVQRVSAEINSTPAGTTNFY